MGTSSVSNSVLISLRAISAFLRSVSRISGLNCRISRCGLALGLVFVVAGDCSGTVVVFRVGLMTVGLSDFTHHGVGLALVFGVVVLRGGCGVRATSSSWVFIPFSFRDKLTTPSYTF